MQRSPGSSTVAWAPSFQSFTLRLVSPRGHTASCDRGGTTTGRLERLIGQIGFTTIASMPGCRIGPPAAIA
jgi:hypothetical protein